MSFLADVYVAAPSRHERFVNELLDHFLGPSRTSNVGSVVVDGAEVSDPTEFLRLLVARPSLEGSWYWQATSVERHAHCHFTKDGGLILGLSCPEDTDEEALLEEMKRIFAPTDGYIGYESPPEATLVAFLRAAQRARERSR